MIYKIHGTKKCTMNGGFVEISIESARLEDAFARFRRDFPTSGDPHCIGEFLTWSAYEADQQRQRDEWFFSASAPAAVEAAA